jgi:hypothetical protein
MMLRLHPPPPAQAEARLAAQVVAVLSDGSTDLGHELSERLRVAREAALERGRLRLRQRAPASSAAAVVVGRSSGAAVLAGPPAWWVKAGAWLPLALLLVGLWAIDNWNLHEQVLAAADVDAALLADDLPPQAFSDPGFAEYLRSSPQGDND